MRSFKTLQALMRHGRQYVLSRISDKLAGVGMVCNVCMWICVVWMCMRIYLQHLA